MAIAAMTPEAKLCRLLYGYPYCASAQSLTATTTRRAALSDLVENMDGDARRSFELRRPSLATGWL